MKNIPLAFLFLTCFLGLQAQNLISITPIDTTPKVQINFIASGMAMHDVANFKVLYYTDDVDGNQSVASGMLSLPVSNCPFYTMAVYNHGTVSIKEDVPSRGVFESMLGKIFASRNYVTVMPDYLGLGDSPGLHPYMHEKTQATATLDMIRAVRQALQDSISGYLVFDDVLLTGYSQGGHAAMGTAKYIQENNLEGEFDVLATVPASGPYNLAGSQARVFIDDLPYSNPGYVVYLLMGMNEAHQGTLFDSYSDILQSPYDTLVPPYFDGTNDMTTINALLPARASDYLVDTFLQAFVADTAIQEHWLWELLNENTNYDWKPEHPVGLMYCTMDEQVEYQNSLDAEAAMLARGVDVMAQNNGPYSHVNCVLPSMVEVAVFFDSVAITCGVLNEVDEIKTTNTTTCYPNPSNDQFFIEGIHRSTDITIYNQMGQVVLESRVTAQQAIDISTFPAGIYVVRVVSGNLREKHLLIVE